MLSAGQAFKQIYAAIHLSRGVAHMHTLESRQFLVRAFVQTGLARENSHDRLTWVQAFISYKWEKAVGWFRSRSEYSRIS
jgi:hypothetical protein